MNGWSSRNSRRLAIGRGLTLGQRYRRSAAALLIAAVLSPNAVHAGSAKEDEARRNLHESERARAEQLAASKDAADRAQQAAARAGRLAQERVAAAAKLQQADAITQDVAARIDSLAAQRRDAEHRLQERAASMQPLLPLLERLSLYPAETLLAMQGQPESTLRGVLVLKSLSHQIEQDAEALRKDQADLDTASAALQAQAPELADAEARQKREAEALDRAIEEAHSDQSKAEAEAGLAEGHAAQAAARADSLRAALAVLEAQQRAEAARAQQEAARAEAEAETDRIDRQKRADTQRAERKRDTVVVGAAGGPLAGHGEGSLSGGVSPNGQLQSPVIGVVVKGWGDQTDSGPATGVFYHAPPNARVISPCGGRVVFADLFRTYGLLLIVDCGGGYHVVLAGFEKLDVKLGQRIVSGEPVGVMPSWEPGATAKRPALYVELRHDGQPVNPAPWLKSSS